MATTKKTQKVLLELELPADKLESLKPMMKDGKLKIVMGKNSFVACNAAFVACNAAFTEHKAAFVACNAAFTK
jgi:predicted transcriptional regulator